ncbi:VWA domain-containing protein [Arhodomonas aquaeolei]|uniref:VWA domain-containing protein n=1 Tax=Arhodomonas aquaeolei TaxID=2369 RepID=UPI00037FD752|nr:VWA domain-containing protein [Arhodomonas aquaeolei]
MSLLRTCCRAACAAVVTLAASAVAPAADRAPPAAPNTVFVLDASGSMWGRIDGEPKIAIARRVLGDLIEARDPADVLGLVAYGHRRKGDCSDIEVLVEPGAGTGAAIRKAVEGLSPKGKTPLSAAVRQAAETLKYREDRASVILISDGRETCDLDPCEVGRRLEETGVGFTAHVIGFGIEEKNTRSQLACLAESTGGRYLTADTANELSRALETVSAAPATVDVRIEAVDGEGGPVIGHGLRWGLTRDGDGERLLDNEGMAAVNMALDPGRYHAEVLRIEDEASAGRDVVIEEGSGQRTVTVVLPPLRPPASLDGPASALAASSVQVGWDGPDGKDDYVAVARPEAEARDSINYSYTRDGDPVTLTMPPEAGTYELRYIQQEGHRILARREITVEPVEASLDAPETANVAAPVQVRWQGPDYQDDYVTVARPDADARDYEGYTYTRKGNPLTLTMPPEPGTYELRYIQHEGRKVLARRDITVEAVSASLDAPETAKAAAPVQVRWQGPDYQDDYVTVARPDDGARDYEGYTYTRDGNPLRLTMPPEAGTYELRYIQHEGRKVLARREIIVEAVEAGLDAPETAKAAEPVLVTWQGPDYQDDYVTVARPDDGARDYEGYTYTRDGNPLRLTMPPEAGTYELRYIQHEGRKVLAQRRITVEPVEASLDAPARAAAGGSIQVRWQGPDYRDDYVTLARPDDGPRDYESYTYTRDGNPLSLSTPAEPGAYELRYIQHEGRRIIATTPLEVIPAEE